MSGNRRIALKALAGWGLIAVGCGQGKSMPPNGARDGGVRPLDAGDALDAGGPTDAGGTSRFRLVVNNPFAEAPCAYPSAFGNEGNQLIGVCTPTMRPDMTGDGRNGLFSIDTNGTPTIPSRSFVMFPFNQRRFLNHYVRWPGTMWPFGVVTANDGFYIFDPMEMMLTGVTDDRNFVPFPAGYNSGGGAVLKNTTDGLRLCIAAANFNGMQYEQGAVLVYPFTPGNNPPKMMVGQPTPILMDKLNSTGLAIDSRGLLTVLCSGASTFSGQPREAAIEFINLEDATLQRGLAISLGELSASLGGEIALIEGGTVALVGSSDNTGRVFRVDFLTKGHSNRALVSDADSHFFAGMSVLGGGQLVVGDFNTGMIWNVETANLADIQPPLNSGLSQLGPSRTVGNAVFQAGVNAGNQGHVVRLVAA